eukprot:CAMPEP_0174908690 /NCGR_PEP_ID=MMETSP0167-20121228/65483_1 /TAXON_ID=38298 /ORGANISM="Rhodella maculata, Strain CCMP736" /LENGTH=63 /DNA_ID=CAMNT_0016152505 /DNA_START=24 /DNA_END=215 /DNA_ORIENTATION=-
MGGAAWSRRRVPVNPPSGRAGSVRDRDDHHMAASQGIVVMTAAASLSLAMMTLPCTHDFVALH